MNTEKDRLEKIAVDSIYAKGISVITQQYCCKIFMRYKKPGNILELGPAEGVMTDILYPLHPEQYTVVDGSSTFIDQIKSRYPLINAFAEIFEEFGQSANTPPI